MSWWPRRRRRVVTRLRLASRSRSWTLCRGRSSPKPATPTISATGSATESDCRSTKHRESARPPPVHCLLARRSPWSPVSICPTTAVSESRTRWSSARRPWSRTAGYMRPQTYSPGSRKNWRSSRGEQPKVATTADFKNGLVLQIDGQLWQIVEFQHVKPGKGPAFVRTKLKNVLTGKVVDKTYNAGVKVETATVDRRDATYLYRDGSDFVFMDSQDYEQHPLPEALVGRAAGFLLESLPVQIAFHDGAPLYLELPVTEVIWEGSMPDRRGDRGRHQARKRAVDLLFEAEARGITPAEVAESRNALAHHQSEMAPLNPYTVTVARGVTEHS